jgi:beta-N-acetylhexosaminidase
VSTDLLPLIVGLPGPSIDDPEAEVLAAVRPAGVILFARNVVSSEQVRGLVKAIQQLEPQPFVCVDLEGGRVNRLAGLWGDLPSPAQAAPQGRRAVRALGVAAGAACRCLGIQLDLAPVVDLEAPGGMLAREGRCFSDDPERTAILAGVFASGLGSWSVSGCLKHFPGLGAVPSDTHLELPELGSSAEELGRHLSPFSALSGTVPAVMVAHVVVPALGDAERPASLATTAVQQAAALPGNPVIISDDVEMGALESWGNLGERAVAALKACNHGVIISRSFGRLPEIADFLRQTIQQDPHLRQRIESAASRLGTMRRDLYRTAAAVPAPDDETVAQLWEQARREATP